MSEKRGYLLKEGGGALKQFQRRWFSLESTIVSYAKSPEELSVPLGNIYIEDVVAVTDLPQHGQKNAFRITCTTRDYLLCADTPEDKAEWIKCLRDACERKGVAESLDLPKYATVEQFVNKGVRVSGKVPISLLSDISRGIHPDRKKIDHRGWYIDRHVPVSTILHEFTLYGWTLVDIFQSESLSSLEPGASSIVNTIVFTMQPRRPRGYSVRLASKPVKTPSTTTEGKGEKLPPPKPMLPGGFKLPELGAGISLKQAPQKPPLQPSTPPSPTPQSALLPVKTPPPKAPKPSLPQPVAPSAAPAPSANANAASLPDPRGSTVTIKLNHTDEELEQLMKEFFITMDSITIDAE